MQDAFAAPEHEPDGGQRSATAVLGLVGSELWRLRGLWLQLLLGLPVGVFGLSCVVGLALSLLSLIPSLIFGQAVATGVVALAMLVGAPLGWVRLVQWFWGFAGDQVRNPPRPDILEGPDAGLFSLTARAQRGEWDFRVFLRWIAWSAGALCCWLGMAAVGSGGELVTWLTGVAWLGMLLGFGLQAVAQGLLSPWSLVAAGLTERGSLRETGRQFQARWRSAWLPSAVVAVLRSVLSSLPLLPLVAVPDVIERTAVQAPVLAGVLGLAYASASMTLIVVELVAHTVVWRATDPELAEPEAYGLS